MNLDPLALRVAARYAELTDERKRQITDRVELILSQQKRIEAIPGWDRSNFLLSLHDQVRRRGPLSEKQLAVLEKIEREAQAAKARRPQDVILDPKKQYMQSGQRDAIIRILADKGTVSIYDPAGAVSGNRELQAWFVKELAAGFYGMAENYAEQNADEDDPKRREHNYKMESGAAKAAREMDHARIDVMKIGDGVTTILKVHPTYRELEAKHGIARR